VSQPQTTIEWKKKEKKAGERDNADSGALGNGTEKDKKCVAALAFVG
jgi:hypothetical protein